tara:strand:- start:8200 stop:9060 length:861 start_codon:yes stop_codon:yes gene_type:complete
MALGWISLHRKVLENPVIKPKGRFSDFEAWVFLLLKASHEENKVRVGTYIYKVKSGDIITSQKKLCLRFKWGNSKLRNFLKMLESDEMIAVETNCKLTRITILNFDQLQNKQIANKSKTNQKQIANKSETNTYNNDNKLNNVNKRKDKFSREVVAHCVKSNYLDKEGQVYFPELVEEFIGYWTEMNRTKTRMRFEMEKTFEISRRISTWIARHKDWGKTNIKNKEINEFKLDSTGNAYIGYCSKCNKSDFYDKYNIRNVDSSCCNVKINPKRRKDEKSNKSSYANQ